MIYLLPTLPSSSSVSAQLAAAGVPVVHAAKLYQLVQALADESKFIVVTIEATELLIAAKYMNSLLPIVPTVIMAAPEVSYPSEWATVAASFVSVDWREFAAKVALSGKLAHDPEQVEKRATVGTPRAKTLFTERGSQLGAKPKVEDPDGPDFDTTLVGE